MKKKSFALLLSAAILTTSAITVVSLADTYRGHDFRNGIDGATYTIKSGLNIKKPTTFPNSTNKIVTNNGNSLTLEITGASGDGDFITLHQNGSISNPYLENVLYCNAINGMTVLKGIPAGLTLSYGWPNQLAEGGYAIETIVTNGSDITFNDFGPSYFRLINKNPNDITINNFELTYGCEQTFDRTTCSQGFTTTHNFEGYNLIYPESSVDGIVILPNIYGGELVDGIDGSYISDYTFSGASDIYIPKGYTCMKAYTFRKNFYGSNPVIRCEEPFQPSSWEDDWNDTIEVVYNCKMPVYKTGKTKDGFSYKILDGVCTITDYNGQEKDVRLPETIVCDGITYTPTVVGNTAFWYNSISTLRVPSNYVAGEDNCFGGEYALLFEAETVTDPVLSDIIKSFYGPTLVGFKKCAQKDNVRLALGKNSTGVDSAIVLSSTNESPILNIKSSYNIEGVDYQTYHVIPAYAFKGNSVLTEITFPKTVTLLGTGVCNDMPNLTKVVINSELSSIKQSSFLGCPKLSDITLPSKIRSIDSNAFMDCISLKTIILPDTLQSISTNAFSGTGLTEIFIPASVKTIYSGVFGNIQNEITVKFEKSIQYINDNGYISDNWNENSPHMTILENQTRN